MSSPDFSQNYFQLFDLPVAFDLDTNQLGRRYRQLQQQLHPDRYANAPAHEQRLAVQYSAFVNEAHATLRAPLARALYLLHLRGLEKEEVSAQQVDGGFLIEQMELREKLASLHDLVDPDTILEHLVAEISGDIRAHQDEFRKAYAKDELPAAASACVKMQYLEKLLAETEQVEAELMDT
jgi:molecular chaperone HscB